MSKQNKTYWFRMKPTKSQEEILDSTGHARRFVWNWALARHKEYYKLNGETISYNLLAAELVTLKMKKEYSFLKLVNAQSLIQVIRDLVQAFKNFFKGTARYPKFKSRKIDPLRFRIPQNVCVNMFGEVLIPKIGFIRLYYSQPVIGKIKSATCKKDACGHWFVSILVEFELEKKELPTPKVSNTIGIDLGLKDFIVTSNEERVPAPKFYRKGEKKLKNANRSLHRKQKGSKRRQKARKKFAKIHQKIRNQRNDFLHKLTTKLVKQNDCVVIEDLNLKGLTRTKLAKSFTDAAMGEFRRQLTYKCLWNHKHLITVDRFFPSTKLCRGCGHINNNLTLNDREWTCSCGMFHDRDLSAAINIRDEGIRLFSPWGTR